VSLVTDQVLVVTGLEGTSELGVATQNSIYPVAGVSGTGQVGTVQVRIDRIVIVTGVSATGNIGSQSPAVNVWSLINTDQNANWTQIAA
jgi:hypothetical protein